MMDREVFRLGVCLGEYLGWIAEPGYTYVRTFGLLRRRRHLDVYARARIQYRLGACETRFIAFEPITQDRLAAS